MTSAGGGAGAAEQLAPLPSPACTNRRARRRAGAMCASLALSPLPLVFSYKSESPCVDTGWATVLLGYIHLYAPAAVGYVLNDFAWPLVIQTTTVFAHGILRCRGKLKDGSDTAGRLAEAGKWLKRAVTLDATRQEPYAMLAERYVRRCLRACGPSLPSWNKHRHRSDNRCGVATRLRVVSMTKRSATDLQLHSYQFLEHRRFVGPCLTSSGSSTSAMRRCSTVRGSTCI